MHRMIKYALGLLVSLVMLNGCNGTVQIGLEPASTPQPALSATLESLVGENSRLSTLVARQVTPVPPPLNLGQIAYVQGGDIWSETVLDQASLRPQRLTKDGNNREPRWSSSGRWLVYRKERQSILPPTGLTISTTILATESAQAQSRQVWLIQADGNGEHPLHQGETVDAFAWWPGGDKLAYTTATGGLYTINAAGTNLATLVPAVSLPSDRQQQIPRVAWSPDGMWLAYELHIQPTEHIPPYQGVWMVSADGKTSVELYQSSEPQSGQLLLLGWSSHGKSVLFWYRATSGEPLSMGGSIHAITADKTKPARTLAETTSYAQTLPYADFIAPAPPSPLWQDFEVLAFVAGGDQATWKNKSINSLGQTISPPHLAAVSPAWSPDGAQLAFSAMPEQLDVDYLDINKLMQRRIWVANAVGDPKPRRLTDTPGYRDEHPLWSLAGDQLLFVRINGQGQATLWLIAYDGSSSRQVVDELTPAPDPFDAAGYVDWTTLFDWWRGS